MVQEGSGGVKGLEFRVQGSRSGLTVRALVEARFGAVWAGGPKIFGLEGVWHAYLAQCINKMILESQLPHEIVNILS